MRRRTTIAALATIAMALALVGWLGSGGSAAPTPARPTKQELARKLLATKGLQLTPAARAFVARVAAGGERAAEPEGAEARAKAGTAAATAAGPAVQVAGPGLGNVRVNDPARDRHQQDQTTQSETTIAVAGRNVAVGYNDSQQSLLFTTQGSSLSGYSYSRDGGRTFTDGGPLPNRPGYVNFGDPWLTSDQAGRMYYATLAGTPNFNLGVSVARSTDGGRSWSAPLQVSPGDPPVDLYIGDKEAITAGRGPSRPDRDVLYMAWDDLFFSATDILSGLPVARSSDGGRTWTVAYAARHSLFEGCSFTQYLGAQPIVDPADGTLYVAAERFQVDDPNCQGAELVTSEVIFKSTDGGRSFGPAVTIADITPAGTADTAAGPAILLGPGKAMRTAEFPVLAFHRGVLYVAWNEALGGHSHLRLARSTDAGASWRLRWLTGGNADQAQPALSSDREGLHVLYYSIAPTRPDRLIDVAVLDSADGAGFSAQRVTNRSFPGVLNIQQFDPLIAPYYMGDYLANVSDGARQYFAWGDNRDRVRNWLYPSGRHDPNVYFAQR